MHLYHMAYSTNQKFYCNHEVGHMVSIKIPTVAMFCMNTALCILHTKIGLIVTAIQCRFVYLCYLAK